jgi:hypothetical protein
MTSRININMIQGINGTGKRNGVGKVITIRKRHLMRSGSSQQQVPAGLRHSSLLPNSQHY